jgi:hypothetical protein
MSLETHPPQGPIASFVSTLPSSPYDGQECYYLADAAAGIVWHLRYRAASTSAYKWEMLGGAPLRGADLGNGGDPTAAGESTTSAAFVDLATLGPDVTVPLAGEYLVSWGFTVIGNLTPANVQMSIANGATAASGNDSILQYIHTANSYYTLSRTRQFTCVAGALLRCKYAGYTGMTTYFSKRWMNARPLRVG